MKKFLTFALLFCVALTTTSCLKSLGGDGEEEGVGVNGVTLDKTTLTMTKGEKSILIATVTPSVADNQTVSWSSSKESIASVSDDGQITALAAGKTIITVTTTESAFTATCEVTVVSGSTETPARFQNEGQAGIDGSSWEKAYEIATKEQIILLATRVEKEPQKWRTKYYKQTANIDFGRGNTEIWTPIGGNSEFKGYFDGGNHIIKGLLTAAANATKFGLFGSVHGGEIKNVRFEGSFNISAITEVNAITGGILARCQDKAFITNCSNTADISGAGLIGGIIGMCSGESRVMACQNSGKINSTTSSVGGVAAECAGGLVIGCVNKGASITSSNNGSAGGITGVGAPIACWSNATTVSGKQLRTGAITGWINSSLTPPIDSKDCCWKTISGLNGNGGEGAVTGYNSFTRNNPELELSDMMNQTWLAMVPDTKYKFNEQGVILSL